MPIAIANGRPVPAADPGRAAKKVGRPEDSVIQALLPQRTTRSRSSPRAISRASARAPPAMKIQNSVGSTNSCPHSAPSAIIPFTSPAPSQRSRNGTNSASSATPAPASASPSPAAPRVASASDSAVARPPSVSQLGMRRLRTSCSIARKRKAAAHAVAGSGDSWALQRKPALTLAAIATDTPNLEITPDGVRSERFSAISWLTACGAGSRRTELVGARALRAVADAVTNLVQARVDLGAEGAPEDRAGEREHHAHDRPLHHLHARILADQALDLVPEHCVLHFCLAARQWSVSVFGGCAPTPHRPLSIQVVYPFGPLG